MGFDIWAYDEKRHEVAYLRSYMGGFRMTAEQGYDWFKLIDASECDAGVSGNGDEKYISLDKLINALNVLEKHDPRGKLSSEGRDEWTYRKPQLKEFMEKCIDWIKKNNKEEIIIYFG